MKTSFYLFSILVLFIACDDATDEPLTANETLMVGEWKQNEAYISDGGPQYWIDVENGEEIKFKTDGTFSSNNYTECSTGNFSVNENKLFLEYDCDGFETISENENGIITYNIELYSNYFILTPTSGPICIEGCSYKYQRKN
ncbi:hypothetical protein JBL43_02365 [Aureibaculum sp. A20]|uniref:Lipocalin-like domain-containing protein n=1 Tax=Aureibaculum flavum TaxID=2795986 RepID=A0ABS0WM96_9FLAO|nr:hypothetical protein [Aureibaculum flavum]MBJ2173064.1 hypothetical protein [Aureibaculum flavum]